MRWFFAGFLCLMLFALRPCGAEVLINESFDSWTKAPGPGWEASVAPGGGMSLTADGAGGKALRTSCPRGGRSFIIHSLGGDRREVYISLSVKVESLATGTTWQQFDPTIVVMQLNGHLQDKERYRTQLQMNAKGQDVVMQLFTSHVTVHKTGLCWSRGETLNIGIGIKYDRKGFVKFYYDGVKIYEVNCNTIDPGPDSVDSIRIGCQEGAASALVVDNVTVATREDEAKFIVKSDDTSNPPSIVVDSAKKLGPVNFDCFGVSAGMMAGNPLPYTKLKTATLPLGITSVRWGGKAYWDEYEKYPGPPISFYYKENDASSPYGKDGRSFEEHLSYFGGNPQVVCITNPDGSDYLGKKLDGPNGWVQYNKRRGHRDCIYEVGNETDLAQYLQGGYMFTGQSWEQICDGVARWPPAGPALVAQSLMREGPRVDYTFPFNSKGSALYIGSRERWDDCEIGLLRSGQGGGKLAWAIWTGKDWETVFAGQAGSDYLLTPEPSPDGLHDVRNFATRGQVYWSDSFFKPGGPFERWTPASISQISDGACSGADKLYYVKIWLQSGVYSGGEPQESTMLVGRAPSDYASVVKSYSEIIRRNGGHAYASSASIENRPGWMEMLQSVAPSVDGLAFHGYDAWAPTWDAVSKGEGLYVPFQAMLYNVERLRKITGEIRSKKPLAGKKLALTEWSVPDKGYLGGLGTAIAMCEILKGGWDSANRHNWCASWAHRDDVYSLIRATSSSSDTDWVERPSATVFKFLRHAARADLVKAECLYSAGKQTTHYPGIYVCAFQGARKTEKSLVLVNRTDSDLRDVPINWSDATGLRFRVETLQSSSGLRADNEGVMPQVTMESSPSITFSGDGVARISLPAYSLYILEVIR